MCLIIKELFTNIFGNNIHQTTAHGLKNGNMAAKCENVDGIQKAFKSAKKEKKGVLGICAEGYPSVGDIIAVEFGFLLPLLSCFSYVLRSTNRH